MIGITYGLYSTLDPNKKDPKWANEQITLMRRYWRRLKNIEIAWADRATMYSVKELDKVKESFDDEDFKKHTTFQPLPILEPMVNAVVEDITRTPPKAELRAIDPSAVNMKKQDIAMLRNRNILEGDRSELNSRVGLAPYKIPSSEYNGNVDQFDQMNLDESDNEDISFYEQNLQRLNFEIAGQQVVDAIFKNSRFDKQVTRKLVKDILAFKTVSVQDYVDKVTGEIKSVYRDPEMCYGIFGTTNDGRGDICRGWQDTVSVPEFLEMVGDEFVFERDWRYLLWGINYCNIRKFTGFIRNGTQFDCCGDAGWMTRMGMSEIIEPSLVDWSMAYLFKVYIGYIEWVSPEMTANFLTKKNDKYYAEEIPYDYVLKKKQIKEGYETEARYQMPWYSSYFIATTTVSQWVFDFGKVYFQRTEGSNDEYSNGTLCFYQEEGLSATEIARPYLQMANFTFYRMLWMIYKAKPDPDEFIFDELLQLAKTTQRDFAQTQGGAAAVGMPALDNILNKIIKEMRAKHVRLRTYPRIDGKPVQEIHPIEQKGRGGLDPIAMSMQAVCQWAEQMIAAKIGLNPQRLGQNPPPRESTQSEENTVNFSMQTTGYIYRMVQYLKEHAAVCALNYAQDIINFPGTLPYKWLNQIVGDETFKNIGSLNKFAAHRCGIFIEDYNAELDKQKVEGAATLALQNQEISYPQWFLVTQTQDYKLASMLLGRYKEKAIKEQQEAKIQEQQAAQQLQTMKYQQEKDLINTKGYWDLQVERERTRSYVAAAQIAAKSKVDVKEIQVASETPKIDAKASAQMQVDKNKNDLETQKTLPPLPPVTEKNLDQRTNVTTSVPDTTVAV